MQYTEHYRLKKPQDNESAEIEDIRYNMDAIDAALGLMLPKAELPKSDPAGSAAIVQENLNTHANNKSNPHGTTAAQVGSYTKEENLSAAVKTQYGVPAGGTPTEVLAKIPAIINTAWKKIASYENAGAYTWKAPDLFNGLSYYVGVFIAGGGGSGAASKYDKTAQTWYVGGASGRSNAVIIKVSPNTIYNIVVGAGGAKQQCSTWTTANGATGGTSSFGANTALGGIGGCSISYGQAVGGGAQPSDIYNPIGYGGLITGYGGYPRECFNPFESKMIFGAGGGVSQGTTTTGGKNPATGLGGGDGAFSSGSAAASDATEFGCGGGSAQTTGGTATSGKGGDGLVNVYTMGWLDANS